MKPLPIVEHMKLLKAAIPVRQTKPESEKFSILKKLKSLPVVKQGIFSQLSFCLPFQQGGQDGRLERFIRLVEGIIKQGGTIVEFSEDMGEQFCKYVIVDGHTNVDKLRKKISGLIKYQMMLSYQFVSQSLMSFKRKDYKKYVLFDNTKNMNKEANCSEVAMKRLDEERLNQKMIRPKIENLPQESEIKEKTGSGDNDSEQDKIRLLKIEKVQQELLRYKSEKKAARNVPDVSYAELSQKGLNEINEEMDIVSENSDSQVNQSEIREEVTQISKNHSHHPQKRVEFKPETKFHLQKMQMNHLHPKFLKKEQATDQLIPLDPSVPWQPKSDRKKIWYAPPKNLASHSFAKNNFICDKLMELSQMYKRIGDSRTFNYIRAVACIKSHTKQINNNEDLKEVEGLSSTMLYKIRQLMKTGQIAKLNSFNISQEVNSCRQLQKVWGIGQKKAKQFYDRGIKTVEDLKKKPELITKNMAIGLKYLQEFSKRIPRDKVTRMFEAFKKIFYQLVMTTKMHNIQVVGSYRRGKATCGDIDILICRPDGSVQTKLLLNLVKELEFQGFITESLSHPRLFDGKNNSAYMGVCLFEGQHHRIDIKHYPIEQYAFSLMYFTGSDLFNRQLRMVAHNKGLLLSDHGLKCKERNGQSKIWKGGPIPILKTEQQIFFFLGQDFCTPAERQI